MSTPIFTLDAEVLKMIAIDCGILTTGDQWSLARSSKTMYAICIPALYADTHLEYGWWPNEKEDAKGALRHAASAQFLSINVCSGETGALKAVEKEESYASIIMKDVNLFSALRGVEIAYKATYSKDRYFEVARIVYGLITSRKNLQHLSIRYESDDDYITLSKYGAEIDKAYAEFQDWVAEFEAPILSKLQTIDLYVHEDFPNIPYETNALFQVLEEATENVQEFMAHGGGEPMEGQKVKDPVILKMPSLKVLKIETAHDVERIMNVIDYKIDGLESLHMKKPRCNRHPGIFEKYSDRFVGIRNLFIIEYTAFNDAGKRGKVVLAENLPKLEKLAVARGIGAMDDMEDEVRRDYYLFSRDEQKVTFKKRKMHHKDLGGMAEKVWEEAYQRERKVCELLDSAPRKNMW